MVKTLGNMLSKRLELSTCHLDIQVRYKVVFILESAADVKRVNVYQNWEKPVQNLQGHR